MKLEFRVENGVERWAGLRVKEIGRTDKGRQNRQKSSPVFKRILDSVS